MKKLLEVEMLDLVPDWNNTDLKSGLYYQGGCLYFYKGDKQYPLNVYLEPTMNVSLKEPEPEIKPGPIQVMPDGFNSGVSMSDLTKLVVAIRALPENLKMPEEKS